MYTGSPIGCTATATGVGGIAVSGSFVLTYNGSATPPSAVGSYPVIAIFTPGDASDYVSGARGTGTLYIVPMNPMVSNLSPWHIAAGATDTVLIVTGANFESNAMIQWDGANLPTTLNSDGTLSATVPAADLAKVGTAAVTVYNPPPSANSPSATSPAFQFAIDSPPNAPGVVTVSTTNTSVTIAAGGSTNVPVTLVGAGSTAIVSATCVNLPAGANCTYSNGIVAVTAGANTPAGTYNITVIFTTTQMVASAGPAERSRVRTMGFAAWSGIMGLPLGLLWMRRARKKALRRLLLRVIGVVLALSLVGCGGKISSTPANAATTQTSMQVTLQIGQ
jgi:hypothetical protein